jgi:hypothetical protein
LETKTEEFYEFKLLKSAEEKEIKNKQKKIEKKLKCIHEKEAQLKVEKTNLERSKNKNHEEDFNQNFRLDPKVSSIHVTESLALAQEVSQQKLKEKELFEVSNCSHEPQCILRVPHPHPIGPITLQQHELQMEVDKNDADREKIESAKKKILKFMENEPGDSFDVTLAKLEVLKSLFEPEDGTQTSEFDDLIAMVQSYKTALEDAREDEHDDDDLIDEDDNFPPYYWGGEDACELFFFDE